MEGGYDVIVIGGGPAGCAAAIHLSSQGLGVLLLEKDIMPRDKLCGEFHSTEVADLCRRLGVADRLMEAGACPIRRLRATSVRGGAVVTSLPGTAFGISRRTFDNVLFVRAREAGADTQDGTAVREVQGDLSHGFRVSTDESEFTGRLVLGAYGRSSTLDRKLSRSLAPARSAYVAFKAHFHGDFPDGNIELHAFPGGYCGLLKEDSAEVNVCWISSEDALRRSGGSPEQMVESTLKSNPALAERLSGLDRAQEYLAASQLSFRSKSAFSGDVCMIGDAAGMIAPLCGDGMAMALTTGELVAPLVHDFLAANIDAETFRRRYERTWHQYFRRRMILGRYVHAGYVRSPLSELGIRFFAAFPSVTNALVRATRG